MNRKHLIGYIIMMMSLLCFSGCTYGKSLDKTEEEIRYLAYVYVQGDKYETILNGDTAKVTMESIDKEHLIMGKESALDLQGRAVYKVLFRTKNDALLGPIRVYLDANTYEVLGVDFRF